LGIKGLKKLQSNKIALDFGGGKDAKDSSTIKIDKTGSIEICRVLIRLTISN